MNLERFNNSDYQNRKGNYPKAGIPTSVEEVDGKLEFDFKNTAEDVALKFVKNFCSTNQLVPSEVKAFQDGDFENDWVLVVAKFQ